MADILGKQTDMPVLQVEQDVEIEADTVYLIPPKKNLKVVGNRLRLSDYDHAVLNHPIDIFFTSLADEYRERSVGVVQSPQSRARCSMEAPGTAPEAPRRLPLRRRPQRRTMQGSGRCAAGYLYS